MMLCVCGISCAHYRVVPSGEAQIMLRKGETLTAPHDGVFVPDALWIEMNEALEDGRPKPAAGTAR
jgi:hypothetical protein